MTQSPDGRDRDHRRRRPREVSVPQGSERAVSIYRLSTAHVLRAIGPAVIMLGLLWVAVALLEPPTVLRGLLGLVTLAALGLSVGCLLRPPRVLSLDQDGYRVSLVRGVGVSSAAWKEVESVGTELRGRTPSLRFTLSDERTSVVPLSLLGAQNVVAQREVHARLNEAHGYRQL
jgi:hypothetical protein